MRSWRKLRSPTDHPEMREQRTERALVRPLLRSIPCVTGKYQPVGLIACKVDVKARSSCNLLVIRETRRAISRSRGFRVYTQRLHTCIFAKRPKVSTSLILSDAPFVFFFQISSTTHITCESLSRNKRKITSHKQKIYCFCLIPWIIY